MHLPIHETVAGAPDTGCNAITCICGYNFSWHQLVQDRNRQVADAFRDAYPENTARLAAEMIRRGRPAAGAEAAEQQAPPDATAAGGGGGGGGGGNVSAGATGSSSEDREADGRGPEAAQEPIVEAAGEEEGVPMGNAPMSAEDNFRLANGYARAYSREVNRANAGIYGEENPHFTVQRARIQVGQPGTHLMTTSSRRMTRLAYHYRGVLSGDGVTVLSVWGRLEVERLGTHIVFPLACDALCLTATLLPEQSHLDDWRNLAPAVSTYTGRPRPAASPSSEAETEWQATAAANWLVENRVSLISYSRMLCSKL